jgi:hypothetical protein
MSEHLVEYFIPVLASMVGPDPACDVCIRVDGGVFGADRKCASEHFIGYSILYLTYTMSPA